MKKKILSVLTAVTLIAALGACGNENDGAASGVGSSTGESSNPAIDHDIKCEITFLTHKQGMEDDFARYQEEFNKIYPNVTITYEPIADYKDNIEIRLSSGNWGDMCMIPHQFMAETEYPNYFVSLGTIDEFSDKYEFAEAFSLNNEVYGITSTGTAYGVLWNKAVLAQAGVTEFPKSEQEFYDVLQKVKDNTDAIPCYCNYGAGSRLADWEWNARGSMTADSDYKNKLIYMDSPFAEGTPYYTVMRMLYNVVDRGLVEDDPTTSTWDTCSNLLATGDVACTVIGSWACMDTKKKCDNPDDIVFAAFPCNINGAQYATVAADYAYAINKNIDPDKYQVAKDYIIYLTEESNFSYDSGGIPIAKGQEYPDTLIALQEANVTLIPDNPCHTEDLGVFDKINETSELMLGKYYEKARIVEAAMGQRSETFDEIMADWNKRWHDAQAEVIGEENIGANKY